MEAVSSQPSAVSPRVEPEKEPELSPACLVDLAEVHLRHGGPERALKLLGQAAARSVDPSEKSAAYRRLAEVLQMLGRKEDAITNLRTAAQQAPEPWLRRRIQEDLARALAGRPAEEAEAWWEAVLAAANDDDVSSLLRSWSEALRQAGRAEAEQERLRVELAGLEPAPRAREAYLALLPPRDPERLRLLDEDAAARPDDPLVLARLVGELHDDVTEQRARKAELYRKLARLLPPQRGRYLEQLARLEMGAGNRESAREIAREMAGRPGADADEDAVDDDAIVRGARLLVELERAREAEPLLRPLIERAPDLPRRQALELELASALVSAAGASEARAIRERIAREGADDSLRRRAAAELGDMR